MQEFDIINKYFKPLIGKGALDLIDDCAIVQVKDNLIINTDTIVSNQHFFLEDPAPSIATKILMVNLSDITAMGAKPLYYSLSISLPKNHHNLYNEQWLSEFADTLKKIQELHNFYLIGGDTTTSNNDLVISVTMFGKQYASKPLLKSTAQVNEDVFVSGTIGDSYWGLQILKNYEKFRFLSKEHKDFLINNYHYPKPPIHLAKLLVNYASSCTDVSDGLWVDLEKLCNYSKVLGHINLADVPLSKAVQEIVKNETDIIKSITGGDDYQLIFTLPKSKSVNFQKYCKENCLAITKIGHIDNNNTHGLIVKNAKGEILTCATKGFVH